nr:MAG TPA: hypothetical protein [Caudoviricetes sp.]
MGIASIWVIYLFFPLVLVSTIVKRWSFQETVFDKSICIFRR